MIELFPYQVEGARWIASKEKALLSDDMGLGKTGQAIHGADIIGAQDILVICPGAVRVNWEREFERFSPFDRPCSVIFTGKDKIPDHGVVVVSYDLAVPLAPKLKARTWDLIVIDEAHFLKEKTAKRTKAIYGRGRSTPGIIQSGRKVWGLTGTPAPNNFSELWTHLFFMGVIDVSYWDFVFRYCSGFESNYGFKITGHKNVDELRAILKPVMLRRKKEAVLKDLPPIVFEELTVEKSVVPLDPYFYEQSRIIGAEEFYKRLNLDDLTLRRALQIVGEAEDQNHNSARIDARAAVLQSMNSSSLTTMRRFVGMAKLPKIIEILSDELERNVYDKIVIFAIHQCVIEELRTKLRKFNPVTLYGGTPAEKRQQNIDKFQTNPKCRVFIGNIIAAGTGITLTASDQVAIVEPSWVPGDNAQAIMRVHRIGQKNPVRVRTFCLHRSVDELVLRTLIAKTKEIIRLF